MTKFRRKFYEWVKDEPAFAHARMRNHQPRIFQHDFSEQEQVNVDDPGTVLEGPLASEFALNASNVAQQSTRREIGFRFHHHVQEPGLIQKSHGRGLVTRRLADPPEAGVRQSCHGRVEDRMAIPEV